MARSAFGSWGAFLKTDAPEPVFVHRSMGAQVQRWLYNSRSSQLAQALSVPVSAYFGRRLKRRPQRSPSVPTVVVGDLGFGGAGKTAVVAHLAEALQGRGRVAIVGHGYGGRVRQAIRVSAPDAREYGDEAAALFRAMGRSCAIWVGPDRPSVCALAGQDADVVIVDRGLGDPRLPRTLDVVVVDHEAPKGVFPAGPYRTTPRELTGREWIWTHHLVPGHEAEFSGVGSRYRLRAVELPGGQCVDPDWLDGRPVVSLCGLANPRSFYRVLGAAGARLVAGLEVGDHRAFPARALSRLPQDALWVTTAKDRERLPSNLHFAVLHVELELVCGHQRLEALYERLCPA